MRINDLGRNLLLGGAVLASLASGGCKTLNERYIALEVWKYEKCFGHYPPGFTPPGATVAPAAAPAMRPCGQPSDCCQSAAMAGPSGCNDCQGAVVEGGMPSGGVGAPVLPSGPGGSPGPMPAGAVTAGKPVVISDEVVLP
ncbi:MAG: hypothetical protein EBS56_01350 [Planctomycetia bacterium]|nr:hypothetical protein [Planctomycetia bacterium]